MITYRDWTITSSGLLARQYDNLSRRVEVIGDLPAGWEWDLIVKVEGAMDVIALTPMDGGVGHTLTKDQVSIAGYYSVQLRGRQGETVKHTNVIQVFVPASLSGDGQWPTVPSEFTEMEKRLWELNDHPPTPGKNGFWQIWDPDRDEYVDSDIPYVSSGAGGVTGDYIPVPAFAEVGQTIRVSAVDENGKPIKWEAVDMAGDGGEKWETIADITTTEEVESVNITVDAEGKPFELLEAQLYVRVVSTPTNTEQTALRIRTNHNTAAQGGTNDSAVRMFRPTSSAPITTEVRFLCQNSAIQGYINNIDNNTSTIGGYFNPSYPTLTAVYLSGGTFGVGSKIKLTGVRA